MVVIASSSPMVTITNAPTARTQPDRPPAQAGTGRLASGISPSRCRWPIRIGSPICWYRRRNRPTWPPARCARPDVAAVFEPRLARRVPSLRRAGAGRQAVFAEDWNCRRNSALSQAFLLQEQWWSEAARSVRGVSKHHEELVGFTLRQCWTCGRPPISSRPIRRFNDTRWPPAAPTWSRVSRNWSRDALAVLGNAKPRGVEQFLPARPWR